MQEHAVSLAASFRVKLVIAKYPLPLEVQQLASLEVLVAITSGLLATPKFRYCWWFATEAGQSILQASILSQALLTNTTIMQVFHATG